MSSFEEISKRMLGYENEFVDHVLDPIHGQVGITQIESEIMKTEVFSRLKAIKQLGFVSDIYPGATHTRFEHSIGTLHVTWEMLKRFTKNFVRKHPDTEIGNLPDDMDNIIDATRLAALLHDLGHGPFSHSFERVYHHLGIVFDHDELTCYLLSKGLPNDSRKSLGDIRKVRTSRGIRSTKLARFMEELGTIELGTRDVMLCILAKDYKPALEHKGFSLIRYFLNDLIKGDIGSDRIDYLLRDTYYTGLGHRFSLSGILDCINAIYDPIKARLLLAVTDEGKDAVELMLLTRYFHYQFIAHHRENVSQTIRLIPRIQKYLEELKSKNKGALANLISIAMETDWLEKNLPEIEPEYEEVIQARLGDIRHFPLKFLLYRIMVDRYLRQTYLSEIKKLLFGELKEEFSPRDVIFYFTAEKPHVPILHMLLDRYTEGRERKSVLLPDHSPLLINLGRAYLENSSFVVCARSVAYDDIKELIKKRPHFYIDYEILRNTMSRLDPKRLSDYDLLLLSLMKLSKGAKETFKGFGKISDCYRQLKKHLDPSFEFADMEQCYDPLRNANFNHPSSLFNGLLLFDVCKMFRMEIVSGVPYAGYYRPSWEFTPCTLKTFSEKLRREVPTKPARVLRHDFYRKDITRLSTVAFRKRLA